MPPTKSSKDQKPPISLPKLFIGTSSEAINVAEYLQTKLQSVSRVKVWNQGVFGLGRVILEDLIEQARVSDFAVLILTPDDIVKSRGTTQDAPRDNVIFELGLFMGIIGERRTFIVHPKRYRPKLPSDLAGIITSPYDETDDLDAALTGTCIQIKQAIERESRNLRGSYRLLTKLVDSYPKAIGMVDLDLALGYQMILPQQYDELSTALQKKIQEESGN